MDDVFEALSDPSRRLPDSLNLNAEPINAIADRWIRQYERERVPAFGTVWVAGSPMTWGAHGVTIADPGQAVRRLRLPDQTDRRGQGGR